MGNTMATPLCKIALKYGTDKCPQIAHSYTPFYYELLRDKRDSFKKILELGIGYIWRGNRAYYQHGASLYMWREFFPNAHIYGADILPETLFGADRITTFYCDETKEKDLKSLIEKTGSDIDLFVDDGSHKTSHQIFTARTLMPLLKEDVIYIIEDVGYPREVKKALPEYECETPWIEPLCTTAPRGVSRNKLVIVKRK
jgi:hypothetical protein